MHEEDDRRIKKRQEEGVLGLPRTTLPPNRDILSGTLGLGGANTRTQSPSAHSATNNTTLYTSRPGHDLDAPDPEPVPRDNRGTDVNRAQPGPAPTTNFNAELRDIYNDVARHGTYNFLGAQRRVPSGLCIDAWRKHLEGYHDRTLVTFLEFGWPVNFDRDTPVQSTFQNHATGVGYAGDLDFYIETELGHHALAGPFRGPPVVPMHVSPLMTRIKKDAIHRRVIMDLSWPPGAAINTGVDSKWYFDGPIDIKLPTVEFMECRLLTLGRGAYMYKTDLARGYRQLRVDPLDWPLLGFQHNGAIYMDICPPFGLKTSAMFMQRTSEAISHLHGKAGYFSRPYLDDFGGAEPSLPRATSALEALQGIMRELGIKEALHKVCPPAQSMVWLGILFNSIDMTMKIPGEKMEEIGQTLQVWTGKTRATLREMQSLMGLLNFVASVSPPARIFTNRILEGIREAPTRGTETLSLGFKSDLNFFVTIWPRYNGIRILEKHDARCQGDLELDACLTGCGAYIGSHYYSEPFPTDVLQQQHIIAHLELLNVVVATKVWAELWAGQRIKVNCDNTTACLAIQSGRSRDPFIQRCIRELFVLCTVHDIELRAVHKPGEQLQRADALSRAHCSETHRLRVARDSAIQAAERIAVNNQCFQLQEDL